jgi:two-component system NtrC family sensor kinase
MRWFLKKEGLEDAQHYRRLRRNIALVIISLSLTPLLLIGGLTGYRFEALYRERMLAYLQEMVEKHNHDINNFLRERQANIHVLARVFTADQLADESRLERILRSLQDEHRGVFVDLGLVNQNGIQVAYAGPFRLARADYSAAPWFREAMATPSHISDVFLGLRGLPHFIVTVQRQWEGETYVLRSTIDFLAFTTLVEDLRIGESGQVYIMNRFGESQTGPRSNPVLVPETYEAFLADRPLEREVRPVSADRESRIKKVWKQTTGRNRTAIIEKQGATGKNYLGVMTSLKNGNWILFFQQEVADAFSEIRRIRQMAVSILLLGAAAVVGATLLLSRRMVRFIEKADRDRDLMNDQVIETGKLASVGELAAGVAHEINNPVAVMVEEAGWIEDLLADPQFLREGDPEEIRKPLRMIRTQGARCKEITHKLLSFARKTDPDAELLSVNEIVTEVVALSEQKARFGNVQISLFLSEGLPPVRAVVSEMQQVLMNLIHNAIDAIEKKGRGKVEVTTRAEGDRVMLSVADEGQGIPRSVLPRIFDPFFTTKPPGKGTGLGLSICYGIIRKMGGEITVNSAVDVGATFHLSIPAADQADGKRPQAKSEQLPAPPDRPEQPSQPDQSDQTLL